MTLPTPPVFTPVWLAPESVKSWLRIAGVDTADDDILTECCAAVEPQVQRARPDMYTPDGDPPVDVYMPDAEVYKAAGMLAAKLYRRRNSPGGVESFGDNVLYPARWDREIDLALRSASFRIPTTG